jgi:hypothetical protein
VSDGRGTLSADRIRSGDAPEIGAEATARTGDEERHRGRDRRHILRRAWCCGENCREDEWVEDTHRDILI